MVLEKLGSSLKGTLSKIAKAVFVDEKLINELVKDIQRALLQADVNVQLVFDLTNAIKDRIKGEETPAGLTKKEHLVNIVYEELVKFLGEEAKGIKISKKPFKIMMVGLFGSGKCVHADSKIALSNGNVLTAKEIYDKFDLDSNIKTINGNETIIDLSKNNLSVPSFNPETLKIENKKITHLWKIRGKELLDVYLDNGNNYSVKVTPEHPFFVLRKGRLQQVRADQLTEDDFVAVSNNLNISNNNIVDIFPFLKSLDLDIHLDRSEIILPNKDLKQICNDLKFKRNYCKFTTNLKNGKVPISLIDKLDYNTLKINIKNSSKSIIFPRYLTSELAEFLGYLFGDGHLDKKYVQFSNEDPIIIERISFLCKALFGINPSVKKDSRTKSLYDIRIASTTLVNVFNSLFKISIGRKGRYLRIPDILLESNNEILRSFLRAYFDCDAYISKKTRSIELISESDIIISQVNLILMRFGIISTKSKKIVSGIGYSRLLINARYVEKYNEKIGFSLDRKSERRDYHKNIGLRQGCGKQDMIPLSTELRKLRESLGYSLGEIQNNVSNYGNYEKKGLISRESLAKVYDYYSNTDIGITLDVLNKIKHNLIGDIPIPVLNAVVYKLKSERLVEQSSNNIVLTSKGNNLLLEMKCYNKLESLSFIQNLISSDVCWLRVSNIRDFENKEGYVYDFTVEDNHSFIADGIVVHNTTTIGKLAKYFQKRGHKVATIGLDVHRPAAPEQLEQVSKQINAPCFIEKGEKDPVKIYNKYASELEKFDIVLIDTAGRDALSDDLIEEIKTLNKLINPDERLLVISADIGQAAQKQAQAFHDSCGITGVIATKMDGTAKAGGALTACAATEAKIKFIGVGEKIDDLEPFNPKGFVGRLLGMGDIEALLEKAKEAITEEEAQDMSKKFIKGEFNLIDLYQQMEAMKKMGPLSKVMEMVPGMGQLKVPKEMLQVQEGKLKKWKYIMASMTKEELEDPDIVSVSRIDRIAKGSGVSAKDVRELLKQYRQSKKVLKMFKGKGEKGMEQMMKKFKGKVHGM